MLITIFEILAGWSVLAVVTGFALATAIKRAERVHRDVFLNCVFASIEQLQASGS
jgi:hypothetical protein